MGGGQGTGPFVGRVRELALVADAVRTVAAGPTRLVLVTGEQGVGKTRLVVQACAGAQAAGALIVEARCWEDPGAPAYTPWIEVVDTLVRSRGEGVLAELSPVERAALAPLTLQPPENVSTRPVDAPHAQFLLQRAVTAVLRSATASGPVVLAIDDLHAADVPSLRLLRAVLESMHDVALLVLATLRDDAATDDAELLQRLRRSGEVVALAGLDRSAVEQYVDHRLPDADRALREWLWQTTDGNPLFLGELLRLADAGRGGELPKTVVSAVRRRLDNLPRETRKVVEMAAVLGRDVSLPVLGAALDVPPEELLRRLDEAIRHAVLRLDATPWRVRFAHGLMREVVLRDLGVACRALHARAAEVLERLYADDPDRSAEIAQQHYRALPLGGPDAARRWATVAADQAIRQLRFDDAADLLCQALQAQDAAGADAAGRSAMLSRVADAQFRAGRLVAARESWRCAAELARGAGDHDAFAAAVLGLAREMEWGRYSPGRAALLEQALAGDVAPTSRVHLQARLASELYWTSERERRQRLSDEAMALARDLADPAALAAALRGRLWAFRDPDTVDLRLADSNELLTVASEDPETVEEGRYHRIVALLEKGQLTATWREIDAHDRVADALQHPVYRWRSKMWAAMRLCVGGRLDEAELVVEQARSLGEEAGEVNALLISTGQRAENERWTGWRAGTEEMLNTLADAYPAMPLVRCALTAVRADSSADDARRMLNALLDASVLPFDSSWLGAHVWLCDACESLGASQEAAVLLPRLLPYVDRFAASGGGAACQGPVSAIAGALALTAGDPAQAAPLLSRARAESEAVGAPLWSVVTGVRLGSALRLLGRDDEGMLDDALREARRRGLHRVLRLAVCDPASTAGHTSTEHGPGRELTPRQQDVLALLGEGRSNREIARALYVTEKTVKTHVSAVLAKLQLTDRTQAAVYAIRHGVAR